MYDSSQVVLHDADDLSLIYAVLNFHHLEDLDLPEREKTEIRERNVSYEMERVRGRLPPAMGERLRSQTGLKDKFAKALKSSGRYLPLFEKIFESHGIPRELTRLVCVESLFEERSRSRAGASGLWQIMPATGKRYLRVSRHLDERYDPIRATHAAARILRDNYDALGSWPLAVTAYNTGAGIVRQAVRSLGRRDITTIIERYRGGNFGFASRNYFPAFLSALSICENSDHYFGPIAREPLLQFDVVTLPTSATLPQIAFLSGSSIGEVKTLNPAYSNDVLQGRYSLPPGTKLRLPVGFGQIFEARHSTLNRSTSTNKISNY